MFIARDYYYLTYGTIQKDVMNYGPIEASFDVYDDFPSYKSGKHESIMIILYYIYTSHLEFYLNIL